MIIGNYIVSLSLSLSTMLIGIAHALPSLKVSEVSKNFILYLMYDTEMQIKCHQIRKENGKKVKWDVWRWCDWVAAGMEITQSEERELSGGMDGEEMGGANKKTRGSWAFHGGPKGWQAPASHLHCVCVCVCMCVSFCLILWLMKTCQCGNPL